MIVLETPSFGKITCSSQLELFLLTFTLKLSRIFKFTIEIEHYNLPNII